MKGCGFALSTYELNAASAGRASVSHDICSTAPCPALTNKMHYPTNKMHYPYMIWPLGAALRPAIAELILAASCLAVDRDQPFVLVDGKPKCAASDVAFQCRDASCTVLLAPQRGLGPQKM